MMSFHRQRGISLIELMLAMLVLSVGLLGVAALQTTTIRSSQSSQQRVVAVTLATNMAERIRANATQALTGSYVLSKTCSVPSASGSLVSFEMNAWLSEIKTGLGRSTDSTSCGQVTYNAGARTYTVTVFWDDSRALGGLATTSFNYVVRL